MASRGINLHPGGHHPSSVKENTFDVIVIGGGPVGNFAEERLSKAGLSVLVVQHELYGGECHYFGCLPSKALLRPAEALEAARSIAGAKEAVGDGRLDADAVFRRRDAIVDSWDDSKVFSAANAVSGATLARGFARIAGPRQVSVQPHGEAQRFQFNARLAVVVATGSTHVIPDLPGIGSLEEGKELWINRDAVAANKVPEHLVVVGAGPVGCEMATFYSAVGSKVTLISSADQILPSVETEATKIVQRELEKSGVSVKTSAKATKVHKHGPNSLSVELSNGETVSGSVLLIATGRRPRTYDFGLDTIGVAGEGQPLKTDLSLAVPVPQSAEPWLYAVGDVNGLGPTTHMGVYQARIACNAILSSVSDKRNAKAQDGALVTEIKPPAASYPRVIFTEPNISTVGHTLASARAAGLDVRAVDSDFSLPGAMLYGDGQPGWARWVVERGSEKLVGATFCAVEGSEFLNSSQVAILQGLTLKELVHVVPPFPTRGEIWTYLLNAAGY